MINFTKYLYLYFAISAIVIIPGLFFLVRFGVNPSIDFTGGAIIEIKNEKLGTKILKFKPINNEEKQAIIDDLEKENGKIEELRFETVGPILGQELLIKTIVAVVLAAGFILFYLTLQFKNKIYGITAIFAMFHDTLVIVGVFAALGYFLKVEVDTLFVTAILTSLSFSVHDTVVVYDRIRESLKKSPKLGFEEIVNQSLNQTMTRSINNSLTIIFMLASLFFLGGETIKWFIFALLVGTISGTYSSPFVATPLLVLWKRLQIKRRKS